MQYRTFPATGDQLSVLGFGAMGFAGWFGTSTTATRSVRCTPPWTSASTSSTPPVPTAAARRSSAKRSSEWTGPAPVRRNQDQADRPAEPVRHSAGGRGGLPEGLGDRELRDVAARTGPGRRRPDAAAPVLADLGSRRLLDGRAAGAETVRQGPLGRHLDSGPPARQRDLARGERPDRLGADDPAHLRQRAARHPDPDLPAEQRRGHRPLHSRRRWTDRGAHRGQ